MGNMEVMKVKPEYGSHIPVLIKLVGMTTGDVLEMGTGLFSTPFLHWACFGRNLYSYDNDAEYVKLWRKFQSETHRIILVENWDEAEIERPWDIALIDHAPGDRRVVDIKRLANWAKYIVAHDTRWKEDRHYHYKQVFPMFKYRYDHSVCSAHTSILSNLVDLSGFTI